VSNCPVSVRRRTDVRRAVCVSEGAVTSENHPCVRGRSPMPARNRIRASPVPARSATHGGRSKPVSVSRGYRPERQGRGLARHQTICNTNTDNYTEPDDDKPRYEYDASHHDIKDVRLQCSHDPASGFCLAAPISPPRDVERTEQTQVDHSHPQRPCERGCPRTVTLGAKGQREQPQL